MAASTRTELVEHLSSGRFHEIIGTEEGGQIEFKSRPYNLRSPKGRVDLVSDVGSFADNRGGTIVIGVETKKDETSRREYASGIRGVDVTEIDVEAIRKIVQSWVHPLVRDLEIRRYSNGETDLVAIHIEPQDERAKPFLVSLLVDPDNPEKALSHAVGWATRSGPETYWHHAAEIQQALAAGSRRAPQDADRSTYDPSEEAQEHLRLLEDNLEDWDKRPTYVLQVALRMPDPIEDFYGRFRQSVQSWRGIRQYGFNLSLEWSNLMPIGDTLAVLVDDGPSVIVGRTGLLTTACPVSPRFLGWGTRPASESAVINATALIEFTLESLRLAYGCIGSYEEHVLTGSIQCLARNWSTVLLNRHQFPFSFQNASAPSIDLRLDGTGNAAKDAARVVVEVFGREFGLGEDQVPYIEEGQVDLSLIPNQ